MTMRYFVVATECKFCINDLYPGGEHTHGLDPAVRVTEVTEIPASSLPVEAKESAP